MSQHEQVKGFFDKYAKGGNTTTQTVNNTTYTTEQRVTGGQNVTSPVY